MSKELKDKFGRSYKYLRISVTDRCNFKCKYCIPNDDFEYLSHNKILSYEEMLQAVDAFAQLGVNKVRITGGEPLVRKNISFFLKKVKDIPGIKEVTLTTNGSLLHKFAKDIHEAGINRINVSLDSLREDRYSFITGGFDLKTIINGINIAKKEGIKPIKVNTVVIRGFNDDEIIDFCDFAANNDIVVRFIEFMPIGNSAGWHKDNIITGKEIIDIISKKYSLEKVDRKAMDGPAKNFKLSSGGMIGVITPISQHFCSECDKIRLTADGKIRPCLLSDDEVDVREIIRSGSIEDIKKKVRESLNIKQEEHHLSNRSCRELYKRTMSKIGG